MGAGGTVLPERLSLKLRCPLGPSLGARWLRLRCPSAGARVQSLEVNAPQLRGAWHSWRPACCSQHGHGDLQQRLQKRPLSFTGQDIQLCWQAVGCVGSVPETF